TRGAAENPLGSGGPVWVMCGERAEDKLPIFLRLLDAAGLRRRLEECARAGGKAISELRVAIKPSFMLGYHRKDRSCLTDPELVRELARYLRAAGCGDVAVVESPNIYDQFYRHRTVPEVARYFDIPAPEFRLVDLGDEQVPHAYGRGMAQYAVGRTWRDADFRISFRKVRNPPVEHAARRFPLVRRPERVDPGDRSGRADRGLARAPPQRALVDLELRRVPDLRLRKRTRHALRPRDGRGGLPARGASGPRAARGAEAPAGLSRPPISAVTRTVVVVGAGMGGLTAALRLARAGFRVRVLEARAEPGGLASGF